MQKFAVEFEQLLESWKLLLQKAEERKFDQSATLKTCIRICSIILANLWKRVKEHGFPDKDCEIYFFKRVKPVVMSWYIFYLKRHRLHTGYHNGSGLLEKEWLEKEVRDIERFFADNQIYYAYYKNDCIHHDKVYFVRGQYDLNICPEPRQFDDVFTTSFDGMLAKLKANELLLQYIDDMLEPSVKSSRPTASATLAWTASYVELVELGYALYVAGVFNKGKATLKKIMELLSVTFRVKLKEFSHAFNQSQERKGNVTNFLDKLKADLLSYITRLEKRREEK